MKKESNAARHKSPLTRTEKASERMPSPAEYFAKCTKKEQAVKVYTIAETQHTVHIQVIAYAASLSLHIIRRTRLQLSELNYPVQTQQ